MNTGTTIALALGGTAVLGGGGYLLYRAAVSAGTKSAQQLGIAEAATALAPALAGVGQGIAGLGGGIGSGVAGLGGGIGSGVAGLGGGIGSGVSKVGGAVEGIGKGVGGAVQAVGSGAGAALAAPATAVRAISRGASAVASDAYGGAKKVVNYANPVTQVKAIGNAVSKLKFW